VKNVLQLLKIGLLLTGLCILWVVTANGQCTVHNRDGGSINATIGGSLSANSQVGQTFMPCQTGEISSIAITHSNADLGSAGTYELYIALEPGSGSALPTTPVASVVLVAAPTPSQVLTFNLPTPFPVTKGTSYRFAVTNTSGGFNIRMTTPSDYSDGNTVNSFNLFSPTFDLDFEIQIQNATPSLATTPVPTLSQWGLLIFGLLIMNLSVFFVQRRELI
jgi:hypothetical protein